jgi:hypothetical protein
MILGSLPQNQKFYRPSIVGAGGGPRPDEKELAVIPALRTDGSKEERYSEKEEGSRHLFSKREKEQMVILSPARLHYSSYQYAYKLPTRDDKKDSDSNKK